MASIDEEWRKIIEICIQGNETLRQLTEVMLQFSEKVDDSA